MNDAQPAVRFAAIIPAYRPDGRLLELLAALSEKSIPAIVVVDDGSGPGYAGIFEKAGGFPKVALVRHAVNLGKGAALKSGFNYALCAFPELLGVVTADADGQHHAEDIEAVAARLAAEPEHLIMGTRSFSSDIPLRSQVGNQITRVVMRALVGQNIADTQTGLRGIPATLLPQLLRTESNGYDFELDMLIAVRQLALHIDEVPIRTIYEPGNRSSHFSPLVDSMKIYFVLLRFSSVSVMSAVIDSLVFYLAYRQLGNLAWSQILGRLFGVAFNYSMVRKAVFFSKLRHASVLPKYLLLVCASGTASYAGISFLISRYHVRALAAKIAVETLLFFANFAIQRDFIFGKTVPVAKRGRGRRARIPGWLPQTILAIACSALLGLTLYGFRAAHWLPDTGWTKAGYRRLLHYTWAYGAFSSIILLAAPAYFAAVMAALLFVLSIVALGPMALAALLFLAACNALGTILLGRGRDASAEGQLCATMLGVSVYIFVMYFLARVPVNYAAVYLALLAIPIGIDLRGVARRVAGWARTIGRPGRQPRRQVAALVLLVFVLGMHWLIVLQPESGADALAMHMAIANNIAQHHVLTYRPERILWSVMPMGADWCYTVVYLLGGEYGARLLNFAVLLLIEAMLYRIVRRFVSPALAFLFLALFASTSLVQTVTGSLMVENFLCATILASLLAIWHYGETAQRSFLYAAAFLAGTALNIKLGGAAYVAGIVPVGIFEVRRQVKGLGRRRLLTAAIAVVLLLGAAAPPYVTSWRMTGDPVFPFLNRQFPSPLLDRTVTFTDYRFVQPLTWHSLYDLTFHSDRYCEGRAGSVGFQNLLLVPLGLISLLFVRRHRAAGAALVAFLGAVLVLRFLPNARYLYPSLPLFLAPVAALLGWMKGGWFRRVLTGMAVLCVLVNTLYLPSSNWHHGDFYEQAPLNRKMRESFIHRIVPVREIGEYMNREHPGAPVLLTDSAELAAFNAEVYSSGWHQYGIQSRLFSTHSPQEVENLLRSWNVRYIVVPKPGVKTKVAPATLEDLLRKCSLPEFQSTGYYLARLEDGCQPPAAREPLLVSPGTYDDFDPAIAYRGGWGQDARWSTTYAHTLTYTNLPGSQVYLKFNGDVLTYVFTRAANRGKASVTIDGVPKGIVDLYQPQTHWQARAIFAHLGRRPHLAVITVLPEKNPQSTDRFVDVDSFEVQ